MRRQLINYSFILSALFFVSCNSGNKITESEQEVHYNYNSNYGTYYNAKASNFETYEDKANEIVFLGDSITDWCNWSELLNNNRVINRGIGGDIIPGVLYRLKEVTRSEPEKVFIMIGTNDLAGDYSVSDIKENYKRLIEEYQTQSPATEIYVQSVLPTNGDESRPNEDIRSINNHLKTMADSMTYTYIDLHTAFLNDDDELDMQYSYDGLHLNGKGYLVWKDIVNSYVNE